MKQIVKIISLCVVLCGLIILSSCQREDSIDANQDRIYTYYELNYDANDDVTTAKAIFRLGGSSSSKLKLSEGSSVTFNGQELSYNGFYAYYQNELPGIVETGTFVFTDLDGNSFTNEVSFIEIEFPADMPDIEKGTIYDIDWIGNPVAENEVVTFTIDGPADSDNYTVTASQIGAQTIQLTAAKTNSFTTGASILGLERKYETENINAPSVGGEIITKYIAPKVGMNVQEETVQ
ncbi:MAG: hypothetical protein PF448_02625 [Bacteroidales bacterium]|jgi:hypothetical protein|nr:hypothetical protein [Bacteroidales bacterium]